MKGINTMVIEALVIQSSPSKHHSLSFEHIHTSILFIWTNKKFEDQCAKILIYRKRYMNKTSCHLPLCMSQSKQRNSGQIRPSMGALHGIQIRPGMEISGKHERHEKHESKRHCCGAFFHVSPSFWANPYHSSSNSLFHRMLTLMREDARESDTTQNIIHMHRLFRKKVTKHQQADKQVGVDGNPWDSISQIFPLQEYNAQGPVHYTLFTCVQFKCVDVNSPVAPLEIASMT